MKKITSELKRDIIYLILTLFVVSLIIYQLYNMSSITHIERMGIMEAIGLLIITPFLLLTFICIFVFFFILIKNILEKISIMKNYEKVNLYINYLRQNTNASEGLFKFQLKYYLYIGYSYSLVCNKKTDFDKLKFTTGYNATCQNIYYMGYHKVLSDFSSLSKDELEILDYIIKVLKVSNNNVKSIAFFKAYNHVKIDSKGESSPITDYETSTFLKRRTKQYFSQEYFANLPKAIKKIHLEINSKVILKLIDSDCKNILNEISHYDWKSLKNLERNVEEIICRTFNNKNIQIKSIDIKKYEDIKEIISMSNNDKLKRYNYKENPYIIFVSFINNNLLDKNKSYALVTNQINDEILDILKEKLKKILDK